MITEKELYKAINDLENCDNPNFHTCTKLATFYTIKNELYGNNQPEERSAVIEEKIIGDYGDSEFFRAVCGKDAVQVFDVMDELMKTLYVLYPRLYDGVMRKLK